jgi:ABC-type bacteriocin/lantibiotic exporter with double-glycine peptidase domain
MHNAMTKTVLRSKILFFDSNPTGRIVTRFSKDIVVLDFILSSVMTYAVGGLFNAAAVAISAAVVNPYILIAVAIACLIMFYIIKVGSKAMIEA